MKSRKASGTNRDENYFVKAALIWQDSKIDEVPCKIYLPERTLEKPYMVFEPSNGELAHKIVTSHKSALKAIIYSTDKEIQTTFEAPEVYFSESIRKNWGDGISEITIRGEPQDLHIIDHISNHEDHKITRIVFWISPNKLLTPEIMCEKSYTGEIKCDRIRSLDYKIKDNIHIVFDNHFSYKTDENGDCIQWPYLVACADSKIPAADVETLKKGILPYIDDFLLIASFAARKRTCCLGWTATDKNLHSTFYRGNYSFPTDDNNNSTNEKLIEVRDFKRLMQTSFSTFLSFENKLAIRNAIYSVVPYTNQTLETSFLRAFSGLETLILDFKRNESFEFILPGEKWKTLKKYLEKCIRGSTKPKLESQQRASIYRKLNELNRPSLKEVFEVFCQKYAIDLEDLWPVFSNNKTAGLADIRNLLIHGDPLPHRLFSALNIANRHLHYTLERVILRILNWEIEETNVSQSHLYMILAYMNKDLPYEQAQLTEYIKTTSD